MYKPYASPVYKANKDVKLTEPKVSKTLFFFLKLVGRLYLFVFFGIARILLHGEEYLFDSFKRALEGKSRCIIAFRHPNGGEPQLLSWFFLFRLKSLARKSGVRFSRQPHAVFVYGYEVVRWGGWIARFIMPRLGAMPIHHTKLDREGMARIYNAIIGGDYPLALAPEGQVSYTAESVPRLEQGTFRIGFSAAERMENKESDIPVEVLPLSIHFRFGSWGKLTLEGLIKKIERFVFSDKSKKSEKYSFTERLERCREKVLELNEARYSIQSDKNLKFEDRLDNVLEAALESAEKILRVKSEGDFFTRMYGLRQICWDRIVLPGVDTLDNLSRLERGTLDLRAGEAWYAGRHIELVDFCWYFRIPLPEENAPQHTKVEYCQNLWDFVSRTLGGAYHNRINIYPRRVIIQAAPPMNLSERLPAYRQDKKDTIKKAIDDLEKAYLFCIDDVNNM